MAASTPRSVTPIIAKIRNFLNGRELKNHCRFEQLQVPRSGPPPKLPHGASHHLAENYYYSRDGRRESMPSVVVYEAGKKAIESGESAEAKVPTLKTPTPGLGVYNWDM